MSGYTQLWGDSRISKIANLSTTGTELIGVSRGFFMTKEQSGYEFFIDYTNKYGMQFVLPEITSNDTGLNYKFTWVEGMSIGDKNDFQIIARGEDTMSGIVYYRERTTNDVIAISSNSVDVSTADQRLDLGAMILDGSVLNVRSYEGRWVVDGDMGVSHSPGSFNGFQNNNFKKWIIGGTSYRNTGGDSKSTILFSDNGKNWHQTHHIPDIISGTASINGTAFGSENDGTSLYVAVCSYVNSTSKNIITSKTGTSWTLASGAGTCFNGILYDVQGLGVAYGTSSNGNHLWVATGQGDSATNHLLFSYGENAGTCWMDSHSSGDTFGIWGYGVAFGQTDTGSCLWVAVGYDSNTFNSVNSNKNIMYSENGSSWNRSNMAGASFGNIGYSVALGTDHLGNNRWVATGNDTNDNYRKILFSDNGSCWVASSSNSSGVASDAFTVDCVAYGASSNGVCLWVAGAYADTTGSIFYSTDGMSWQRALNNTYNLANKVILSVGYGLSSDATRLWVAGVGSTYAPASHDNIIYSADGKNWHSSGKGSEESVVHSVAYNRPLYPNTYNPIDDIYT